MTCPAAAQPPRREDRATRRHSRAWRGPHRSGRRAAPEAGLNRARHGITSDAPLARSVIVPVATFGDAGLEIAVDSSAAWRPSAVFGFGYRGRRLWACPLSAPLSLGALACAGSDIVHPITRFAVVQPLTCLVPPEIENLPSPPKAAHRLSHIAFVERERAGLYASWLVSRSAYANLRLRAACTKARRTACLAAPKGINRSEPISVSTTCNSVDTSSSRTKRFGDGGLI
jgi:hypothetical protein